MNRQDSPLTAVHRSIYINREVGKINRLLQPTRSLYSTLAETLDVCVGFVLLGYLLVRGCAGGKGGKGGGDEGGDGGGVQPGANTPYLLHVSGHITATSSVRASPAHSIVFPNSLPPCSNGVGNK